MVKEKIVSTSLRLGYKEGRSFSISSIKTDATDENLVRFANAIISLQSKSNKLIQKISTYKLEKSK